MTVLTEPEAATRAARDCSLAAAQLLIFAMGGESTQVRAFDDPDTCETLAEALRTTLEIDLEREHQRSVRSGRADLQVDLIAALNRFLEGWA
ncbi:hypothetical protein NRB_26630 [Novosphingobium sp. 11B]